MLLFSEEPESQKPNPVIGLFFGAVMGLAHRAVAFDHTVTTAFGEGLAWGAVGTVSGNSLTLWSLVVAIFSNRLALWGLVVAIFSNSLTLWGLVVTVFSDQVFFFQAIVTTFSEGLTWGAVGAISGNGLAEHRVSVFHLWGGLVSGWQCKSSAG